MPKPAHSRLTFRGTLGPTAAPIEEWSFGINFTRNVLHDNMTQAELNAIASACRTEYVNNIPGIMPTDVILREVRWALLNDRSHVEQRPDGSYRQGIVTTAAGGAQTPKQVPAQTALVVSLDTPRGGPSGKGRVFLPAPGYFLNAGEKTYSTADMQAVGTAFRTFLNGLTNATSCVPSVVSSKGFMSAVTGIRVGRAPDTLRSRRRDLIESYVRLAVPV